MWHLQILVVDLLVTIVFLTTTSSGVYVSSLKEASDGLVLVHVLHRHGQRTRSEESYPNDPYLYYKFEPYGYEQLTDLGKVQEYRLGRDFRARYNSFLGDSYYPNILQARSSDTERTKMSILLSLAGLFPPPNSSAIEEGLNWQLIPYIYYPTEEDFVLGKPKKFCPEFKSKLKKFTKGDGAAIFEDDLELYKYVANYSGMEIEKPDDIFDFYKYLTAEDEWGLELPEWTKSIWKDQVKQAAAKKFEIRTGTTKLKRLSGGFFLKKVIEDTQNKISGTLDPQDRKLFLYSGHEHNIGVILGALSLYEGVIPNYASYLLFEVRLINGTYGLEIYFQNHNGDVEPQLLTVPGCSSFCPVDQFVKLLEDVIPEKESECE